MSSSDKGLAALTFPPLMYGALAVIFGVVVTSFLLGPSGMGQVQSAVMDILGLLDVIAGLDQAAIDSALATSYAMSCTSIMNQKMPHNAPAVNAYAGEYASAGNQVLAQDRIHQYWYNKSATPIIGQTCNASTANGGVEFGPTNVTVTCDDFERGGGCDVRGFTLPQKNIRGGWVEWILGRGHPEHILYYQALPSGVDESWSNLGERYNAMGVAIGAGVSVVTPSIMKVGKGLVKGAASTSGGLQKAARFVATARKGTQNKARFIASKAGSAISNPRAAARSAGRMVSNYLRRQGARAVKSWRKVFARDISTYATAYARGGSFDDIGQEAIENAVGAVSRELRETGYRNLDQASVRSSVEEVLSRELGDEITDEGIEELSRIMARRWVGASRATAEEFAEMATQQRVSRSATKSGIQKLSFRQSEFQEQAFRQIDAFDRLLGQSSEEIMEDISSISIKADVFESIYGKGIKTVKYVANPARMKRNAIRTACSSNLFRAGMFEGAVSLMDSAEDMANEHDGISQAYAEDMEKLSQGDIQSESGLNHPEGLGHCLAYSGLGAGTAANRMCGRVGVNTPPQLGGANMHGAAACATITMAGITAEKMMSTRTPFLPQESNSLQLFNPVHGTMEFPLNRFANMHFMSLDKTDVGLMGQSKNRFYLVSPVQTKNDTIQGNQPGKLDIEPGGISQRLSGKQRAEKGDADPCNAVDGFKEFVKGNIDTAMYLGIAAATGPFGLIGMLSVGDSLPSLIESQELSVNRSRAINKYNAKGSFLETGLCPNNIVYTDLPIVGKEVIMEQDYQYTDTLWQEERQSLANSNDVVTAPPGFEEAYPSQSTGVQNITDATQLEEEGGEFTYKWSSAMTMAQPIDLGMATTDYQQAGDWLRPHELNQYDFSPKEVADVGIILVLETPTFFEADEWGFDVGLPGAGTVHVSIPPTDIPPDIQSWQISTDAVSMDVEPGSLDQATEYNVTGISLDFSEDWTIGGGPIFQVYADGEVDVGCDGYLPPSGCDAEIDVDAGVNTGDDIAEEDAEFTHTFNWPEIDVSEFLTLVDAEVDHNDMGVETETDGTITIPFEFGGQQIFPEVCVIPSGHICIGPYSVPEVNTEWAVDFKLNTGWVPRKYVSQFGEGVDSYRPPPGLIGSAVEMIDSDRTLNYFVNGLDVTLDTGGPGPYQDTEGNPLFGYDSSDGEAGSMAIYLIGGLVEMAVMALVGVCTATVLGTVICYPLAGLILAGVGGLTEMAAQTYKNGCNWPVHGCNRGLVESTIKGAQVAAGAAADVTAMAAGEAIDAAVDAANDPQAAVGAVHSAAVGMLHSTWDLGVSIGTFLAPTNDSDALDGDIDLNELPTYDDDAVEDPTD